MLEPAAGRFFVIVAPGRGRLAAALRCVPVGGSVLLEPGLHLEDDVVEITNSVGLFGRGAAEIRLGGHAGIEVSAPAAALSGLKLRGAAAMWGPVVCVTAASEARLQDLVIDAGGALQGIRADGNSAPTILRCRIAGARRAGECVSFVGRRCRPRLIECHVDGGPAAALAGGSGGGLQLRPGGVRVDGARALISQCAVRGARPGIFFLNSAGKSRLEHSSVERCSYGVVIDPSCAGLAAQVAAGGNHFRGNARGHVVLRDDERDANFWGL